MAKYLFQANNGLTIDGKGTDQTLLSNIVDDLKGFLTN